MAELSGRRFVACYDLEHQLVSTDFYGWMIEQAAIGADEIVFRTSKYRAGSIYPDHIMRRRFETMIKDGPKFLGLPSREGDDGERVGLGYKFIHFMKFVKENGSSFQRLKSVLPPGNKRYTVTIRQAQKSPYRNSNRDVWLKFAYEIGAEVIEDYEVKPHDLQELMALYAGAEMNFGVWGGPLWMCSLSEYPCMIFKLGVFKFFLEKSGAIYDENMPWLNSNQFTFWESDDDLETICTRFENYLNRNPC